MNSDATDVRLAAKTSVHGDTILLTCAGSAETESLDSLVQVLDAVHRDAIEVAARVVIADLRELEFASSSCLKVFVTWLQRIQELDDHQRYRVRIRSDPSSSWQRRSLGALVAAFGAGGVEIERVNGAYPSGRDS